MLGYNPYVYYPPYPYIHIHHTYRYYPLEKPLSAASFAKRDWSSGKTGQVAWVVSNTYSVRNTRYQYALELAKHIRVDIFGKSTGRQCDGNCRDMSRKYKFYLSFENANCRQYITEKLGMNALECVPCTSHFLLSHSFFLLFSFHSRCALLPHFEDMEWADLILNEHSAFL